MPALATRAPCPPSRLVRRARRLDVALRVVARLEEELPDVDWQHAACLADVATSPELRAQDRAESLAELEERTGLRGARLEQAAAALGRVKREAWRLADLGAAIGNALLGEVARRARRREPRYGLAGLIEGYRAEVEALDELRARLGVRRRVRDRW